MEIPRRVSRATMILDVDVGYVDVQRGADEIEIEMDSGERKI